MAKKSSQTLLIKYTVFIILCVMFMYYGILSSGTNYPEFCDFEVVKPVFPMDQESFTNAMGSIRWKEFKAAIIKNDLEKIRHFSEITLLRLYHFLKKLPSIEKNETCYPPKLKILEDYKCVKRDKPRKVGMLLRFGFDVDALEVHLNELDPVVDKFFLIESVIPHSHFLNRKPLLWDAIKYDGERFSKFLPKIVHFIVDDSVSVTRNATSQKDVWRMEGLQERLRWTKFLEWNQETNYFSSEDLLGFGDTDEIPYLNSVYTLKHCQLPAEPLDVGIWFPFPYINTAFRTDWPVKGHQYTLGDPTFWTVGGAMKLYTDTGKHPNRNRGGSPAYILGGMHMSKYPFPPFQMLKLLTATETSNRGLMEMVEIGMLYARNATNKASARLNEISSRHKRKVKTIPELAKLKGQSEVDAIVKVPWFIQCNPERYPSLKENGFDYRLMGLHGL